MGINKKKSKFWSTYKAIAILFVVILAISGIFFINWLDKYEAKQPSHIAKDTFQSYFSTYDKLSKYIDTAASGMDENTVKEYKEYLKGLYDSGDVSFYNALAEEEGTYKYFVKAGNIKFASFLLRPEGESYIASDFQIQLDGEAAPTGDNLVIIEIPSTYKLSVDGNEIGKDYIKTEKMEDTAYPLYTQNVPEDLADICSYTQYAVPLTEKSVIKVTNADGKEATVEKKDDKYVASVIYDDSMTEEWNDYLIGGMEKYAKYMQYDENSSVVGFGQVSPYFDPTSDLYEDIRTVENGFVTYYDGVYFEDESTSEYTVYNGLTFSCRVKITQVLQKTGWDNTYDYMDVTIYLHKVGDDYLIYYMKQN